jgi:hypothetical protein
MNITIILYLSFIYILYFNEIKADNIYLMARNKYLRLYIANNKNKDKLLSLIKIKEKSENYLHNMKNIAFIKINILYNSILSKYYDINLFYYSLSDEDKLLIDSVISLCY